MSSRSVVAAAELGGKHHDCPLVNQLKQSTSCLALAREPLSERPRSAAIQPTEHESKAQNSYVVPPGRRKLV